MTTEQQIGERTQQHLAQSISHLLIANARLQAENEALHAALAGAERRGTVDGAQGADGPQKDETT